MTKYLYLILGIALTAIIYIGATSTAGQVNPDTYKKSGHDYSRSDGLFQDSSYNHHFITNGSTVANVSSTGTLTSAGLTVTGTTSLTGAVGLTGDTTLTGALVTTRAITPLFNEGFGYGALKGLATLQFDGTAFDGTADVHNVAMAGKNKFLYVPIVAQTLDLAMTATGLNIAMDQTDNDGVEIFAGNLSATGRPFIVGTDPAFKSCVTLAIDDASGTDDFHVMFRKAEVANATVDSYGDRAGLSIVTNASPAAIQIETEVSAGGTTTTDTTDTIADGVTGVWCVLVSAAGAVTYTIDGSAPTVTAAFSFVDGEMLIPAIHLIQHGDLTEELNILNWEVAYQ